MERHRPLSLCAVRQYGKRVEEYRLPKGKDERQKLAEVVGVDGMILLDAIYSEDSLHWQRTADNAQLLVKKRTTEAQRHGENAGKKKGGKSRISGRRVRGIRMKEWHKYAG